MVIREIRPADAAAWEAMRCDMWPDGVDDHAPEIAAFFAGGLDEPCAVFVAEEDSGLLVAIAELSIRYDVAEQQEKKSGYVEGLYVKLNGDVVALHGSC